MYQHRAQISAEWIDTITGEISRARVAPGGPRGARRCLDRFEGVDLEVALEATTGWRFVVENSGSAPRRTWRVGGGQLPEGPQAARED